METVEILDTLMNLPLLSSLPDDARGRTAKLIHTVSKLVTHSDGEALLRKESLGAGTGFVLVQGKVRVKKDDSDDIELAAPALLGEMQQFNPRALRSASVFSSGCTTALTFTWQALYDRVKEDLSMSEQMALMDSIERTVWKRFEQDSLMDLALFKNLSDALRLRVCLTLHWTLRPIVLKNGDVLFEKDAICGDDGYLVMQGQIKLKRNLESLGVVSESDILGIMPVFDPDLKWTATATAIGNVELMKFNWASFMMLLDKRLSSDDMRAFKVAIQEYATNHFTH